MERPTPGNLELVRELYSRLAQEGRFPDELLDYQIEWVNPPDAVEPGIRRGRESFHGATDSIGEAFDEAEVEPEDLIEAGDEVVVLCTFVIKGRGSGLERRQPQGHVWTLRDGKAIRFRWFNDPAEALRAAGVER